MMLIHTHTLALVETQLPPMLGIEVEKETKKRSRCFVVVVLSCAVVGFDYPITLPRLDPVMGGTKEYGQSGAKSKKDDN